MVTDGVEGVGQLGVMGYVCVFLSAFECLGHVSRRKELLAYLDKGGMLAVHRPPAVSAMAGWGAGKV